MKITHNDHSYMKGQYIYNIQRRAKEFSHMRDINIYLRQFLGQFSLYQYKTYPVSL